MDCEVEQQEELLALEAIFDTDLTLHDSVRVGLYLFTTSVACWLTTKRTPIAWVYPHAYCSVRNDAGSHPNLACQLCQYGVGCINPGEFDNEI